MFVKICGITNEEDALLAVALGADALGFVFAPSKRQVTAQQVSHITNRLPRSIMTIGVFRNADPRRVIETVHMSGLKGAQLHGDETPDMSVEVRSQVTWLIKAFAAGSEALKSAPLHRADFLIVDSPTPGSGKVFDWSLLEGVPPASPPVLLAGGLDPDNIVAAITACHPYGVDVSSGVESTPGRKDPRKLRAFIQAARSVPVTRHVGPDTVPYDWGDE